MVSLCVALAAVGCDDGGRDRSSTVAVWYSQGEEPAAVERQVDSSTVAEALEALVAGPSERERDRGYSSWFDGSTVDVIREVRVEGGRVVVDFEPALRERIPGAASSAGSRSLLASLDSTVFQFERVQEAEYRLDGSCEAFWNWLQRECRVVRRR